MLVGGHLEGGLQLRQDGRHLQGGAHLTVKSAVDKVYVREDIMKYKVLISLLCISLFMGCGPSISVEEQQKKSEAQYKLGVAEFNRGNLADALIAFQKARDYYPNDAKIYNGLGLIYLQQQKYRETIAAFQKALELDPNFLEAYNNLGTVYAQIGDWDEAIVQFKEALSSPLYRTPELAHYNLGLALMEKGDNVNAVKEFHAAIQLRPDFSRALDKYGIALYRMNRNQEAIKRFNQAIKISPEFIDPYLNLGMVYMKLGKTQEAIQQFKLVLERSPDENLRTEAARYLEMLE
jgi:superkiller protein 3